MKLKFLLLSIFPIIVILTGCTKTVDKTSNKNEAASACETAAKALAAEREKEPEREAAGRKLTQLEELTDKVAALTEARLAVSEAEKKVRADDNYYRAFKLVERY